MSPMTDGDLSECEILLKRDEIIEIQVSTLETRHK